MIVGAHEQPVLPSRSLATGCNNSNGYLKVDVGVRKSIQFRPGLVRLVHKQLLDHLDLA